MTKPTRIPGTHSKSSFRLMNKQEVAELLGLATRTVDRMVAGEKIPYVRVPSGSGMKTRFIVKDIEQWILQHRRVTVDEALAPKAKPKRESSLEFGAKQRAFAEMARRIEKGDYR